MSSRRNFLKNIVTFSAGAVASTKAFASEHKMPMQDSANEPGVRSRAASAVTHPLLGETPDVPQLPWRTDGGVKEFHLVAEPVKRRLIPGRDMEVWGYNGSCPGPTIQVNQGDRVRIVFENHLPESSTIHWHGLEVPIEMDGLPYISQKPVPPGGTFASDFTLHQPGTFFYHSPRPLPNTIAMHAF